MFFGNKPAFGSPSSNSTNNADAANAFQASGVVTNSGNIGILNAHHGNFNFGISSQPPPFMPSGSSTLTSNIPSNNSENTNNVNTYNSNAITPFSPTQQTPQPQPPPPQYTVPFTNALPTPTLALTGNANYLASFPFNQNQQQQQHHQEKEEKEQSKNSETVQSTNNTTAFTNTAATLGNTNVPSHSAFAPASSTFAKSAFSLHPTNTTTTTTTTAMGKGNNNNSASTSNTPHTTQSTSMSVFGASSAFAMNKIAGITTNTTINNNASKLVFGNTSVLPFSPIAQNATPVTTTNDQTIFKGSDLTEQPQTHTSTTDKEEEEEKEKEELEKEEETWEQQQKEDKKLIAKSLQIPSSNSTTFTNTMFTPTAMPNTTPLTSNTESVFKPRRTQFLYSSSFNSQGTSKQNSTPTSSSTTITSTNTFAPPWQQKESTSELELKSLPLKQSTQTVPSLFTSDWSNKGILSSPAFAPQKVTQAPLAEKPSFDTPTILPLNDSELCLLSRVFASFVETMIKLFNSGNESHTTQPLCASLHRQLELALFGVAGQVGLYAEYDKVVHELLAVLERAKHKNSIASLSLPKSRSPILSVGTSFSASNNINSLMWSKVRGKLWVLIFALGSQVNFITHTLQEYLENQYQLTSNCNSNSSDKKINGMPAMTSNKHISESLYKVKLSIIASAEDALNDACEYANQLGQFALDLYQRDGEDSTSNTNTSSTNIDNMETGYYSILPLLLQRTRLTFEASSALGLPNPRSSSNMRSITSKLFSLLNKRIKQSVVTVVSASQSPPPPPPSAAGLPSTIDNSNSNRIASTSTSPSSPSTLPFTGNAANNAFNKQWKLTWRHEGQRQLIIAFASVIAEMMMSDAPTNEEVEMFIAAFHEALPEARAERCKLYECQANQLFMQPLTMSVVGQASVLLAHALVTLELTSNNTYNNNGNNSNYYYFSTTSSSSKNSVNETRRTLALKLTAAQLALGKLPNVSLLELCQSITTNNNNNNIRSSGTNEEEEKEEENSKTDVQHVFAFPELDDIMMAVRAANMTLYELALRNNAMYYVQNGIHNVLCFVRKRIALLMVVKFYMYKQCDSRLRVPEMVAFYNLHFVSLFEAMTSWLLPLLVEKFINGVLDNDSLVLSEANPFDDYTKDELLQGARTLISVNTQ